MIFDSHAHLNFKDFKADWQQVIMDCQKEDIWLINVGAQLATSIRAIEIADKYSNGVFAAVGLHPLHVADSNFHPEVFVESDYERLIKSSKKVVAIGETGLDFFHNAKNYTKQKEVFIQHLNLAKKFNLPVILHSRNSKDGSKNAYREILEILKPPPGRGKQVQNDKYKVKGVIHCYGGTLEEAKKFLDLGFYVGFTGVITFPKTEGLADIVHQLPLERILIETDCPFLAPQPHRGQRNQPQYVKFVAEKIAEIKGINFDQVAKQTVDNANKLFNI